LCRFYFAFDHNDPVYESGDWRGKIEREFYRLVAEEDKKRWHPAGYVPGETIDGSTLIATMHFVHCDYAAKPAWAHSDAMMAAFKEGADYGFRTNDDTAFPTGEEAGGGWIYTHIQLHAWLAPLLYTLPLMDHPAPHTPAAPAAADIPFACLQCPTGPTA